MSIAEEKQGGRHSNLYLASLSYSLQLVKILLTLMQNLTQVGLAPCKGLTWTSRGEDEGKSNEGAT